MRRREFILGVGAATASPLAADAQRPTSCVSRVGLIVTFFTLTTVAAKQATSGDVPIGMAVRRPGRDGLVASLARPRGARPAIFPMSFAERSFIHWGTISLLSSLRARYGSTTHDQIRRVSGQSRGMPPHGGEGHDPDRPGRMAGTRHRLVRADPRACANRVWTASTRRSGIAERANSDLPLSISHPPALR